LITAKEKKIDYLWYINDNSINNQKIFNQLNADNRIIEGFRYKGITLYKLKID
jgi:hypothetical protein